MNTIVINKILMHMLDFEHRKIYHSTDFVDMNETSIDYYRKKVEKALNSPSLKELTVGSLHEMMLRSEKMVESNEEFIKQAHEMTDKLFALGSVIEEMPNSNVLFVDCYKNGERYVGALKLNYRYIPMSVIDENNIRITKKQVLPTMGSPVDEAIIVNVDTKKLYLIEKKYTIDGKLDFYLNAQWIKGEEKLTDKQKISTMKKVVRKMDDIYNVNDGKALPLMKHEIQEKIDTNQPVKPLEIVKKVLERDGQAQEESEIMMKDLGIGEEDQIESLSLPSMDKCKLVLDDDIEISLPIEEYLSGDKVEKVKQEDGTYSVLLKDVSEVIVK
ncbi:nucleoid-associated protein [Allocoprobacillus halotolerans]|uniref:Nucleoid-associated protein n=1 Tax=Allocoprobacillus halotolerans TaxID=2944914 RepID=A0ABY5I3R2_9FIRM|nr:nucleoid-associated protein [Allocoprobacillus halotolerans]UTY39983.1 nucleoid-associated protein [Allocoprobacillus halotolerans]